MHRCVGRVKKCHAGCSICITRACALQAGLGASPAFRVPEYELQSLYELPLVLALGALCGVASAAFKASSQVGLSHRNVNAVAACTQRPSPVANVC